MDGDDHMFSISTYNGKGIVRLTGELDYERKFLYQLRVLATDRSNNERVLISFKNRFHNYLRKSASQWPVLIAWVCDLITGKHWHRCNCNQSGRRGGPATGVCGGVARDQS